MRRHTQAAACRIAVEFAAAAKVTCRRDCNSNPRLPRNPQSRPDTNRRNHPGARNRRHSARSCSSFGCRCSVLGRTVVLLAIVVHLNDPAVCTKRGKDHPIAIEEFIFRHRYTAAAQGVKNQLRCVKYTIYPLFCNRFHTPERPCRFSPNTRHTAHVFCRSESSPGDKSPVFAVFSPLCHRENTRSLPCPEGQARLRRQARIFIFPCRRGRRSAPAALR